MNELTHTPGPWEIYETAPSFGPPKTILRASDGTLVAEMFEDEHGTVPRADAYLIAAAPELLEVLQEIMPDGFTIRDDFDGEGWLKKARAAIAKATGKAEVTA